MSNLSTTMSSGINHESAISAIASDRREKNYDQSTLWEQLNFSQQFSACSLSQFGYILTYVRYLNGSTLAILKLDNKIATINVAGDINISPGINCR